MDSPVAFIRTFCVNLLSKACDLLILYLPF